MLLSAFGYTKTHLLSTTEEGVQNRYLIIFSFRKLASFLTLLE